jgi:hypothetical protein
LPIFRALVLQGSSHGPKRVLDEMAVLQLIITFLFPVGTKFNGDIYYLFRLEENSPRDPLGLEPFLNLTA